MKVDFDEVKVYTSLDKLRIGSWTSVLLVYNGVWNVMNVDNDIAMSNY